MKILRAITKFIFFILLITATIIFGVIAYLNSNISKEFKIKKGDTLRFNTMVPITAVYEGTVLSQSTKTDTIGEDFDVELKAFGIIPFSVVNVEVVDELHVSVLGNPFGMKLYTEGVLVIEMTEVETEQGKLNPAAKAGIHKGDYIISVNGQNIYTNEDLGEIVLKSGGKNMSFEILRDGTKIFVNFAAVISKETGEYKIGLWIRDSSAGIGTLTFYSPATGVVCGLGHGVCDEDTGTLLQLNSGEVVSAEIISITKGEVGSPGQLKGKFTYNTLGEIDLNSASGIYSFLSGQVNLSNLTEVALKQEIEDGDAQILCTINGTNPKLYSCKIKKRTSAYLADTQNMIITITDPELLSKTGGIVQGMSGSPILQKGKLVGAVTHVLVDDPKCGYAIFAENMLKIAENLNDGLSNAAS